MYANYIEYNVSSTKIIRGQGTQKKQVKGFFIIEALRATSLYMYI